MKTNQIQFLLYAEKNKRETDKMNKLINKKIQLNSVKRSFYMS